MIDAFAESIAKQFSKKIKEALQEGVDAMKLILPKGLVQSARGLNQEQKYKHLRVQTLPVL
ncbi:hypothetical protein Lal_00006196 [Lupinus albus]|uniref:Putative aminoacyl-tRNA hydrolase n=1 Tax=Lupinus albus TaxID=3870 RepID=A0A6A5MSN9_LUPAL|nr:putative aminoacyl-tRNA hydrolase [Lupinus albus]KAF1875568.1 hypothetical protein Lal_00006196 [Lupinus albus]